jgi:hypothetical protein
MKHETPVPTPKVMWAYAYEMVPSQSEDRMRSIQALLDQTRSDAHDAARTWEGRFVREERITHILVVSDSPDGDGEFNQRLEAGMREVEAAFALTAPLAVVEQPHSAADDVP